jgi:hypothetical protein
MTVSTTSIEELDSVAFLRAEGSWPAGTEGAVVSDYGNQKLVEIANENGEGLDFVTIPNDQLRLIHKHRPPRS